MSVRYKRLGLAGLAAIGLLLSAWQMYALAAREALWGSWPLLFLGAGWAVVVALRQNLSRLHFLGLATLGGSALALGFCSAYAWILMAVGYAALLRVTDELASCERSLSKQWWYLYHAMVVYNVGATWWVANTALAAGLVANFLNALLMTVPWVIAAMMRRYLPKIWLLSAVATWIGFEYLHYNWQIAWPWLAIGNGLAAAPGAVQWYEYTGVFGGSLYLSGVGVLLYKLSHQAIGPSMRGQEIGKWAGLLALWIGIPFLFSYYLKGKHEISPIAASTVRIAAIQPNFEPHYVKFRTSERDVLRRVIELTSSVESVDLFVLPETAFGNTDLANLRAGLNGNWPEALQASSTAQYLVGVSGYQRYASPVNDPALRTRISNAGTDSYYTLHNSAVSLRGSLPPEVYNKAKLVPGVEFLPYRKALFVFEPLVKYLGGTTAGLGRSDTAVVFDYARTGIRAAPLICYESIYGNYVREFVQRGANVLTVPTNDGWWDDSPGHRQHLAMASLRAIETRRWVVQAANSGISAIIDSHGTINDQTNYNEVTALVGDVSLLDGETFYVVYGDLLGQLAAGLSIIILLALALIGARHWLQQRTGHD